MRRDDDEPFDTADKRVVKELRAPPGLETPTWSWLYKDPQGKVQGPFADQEMNEWLLGGYSPKSLPIKKADTEDEFAPLSAYEGNPFLAKKRGTLRTEGASEPHAAESEQQEAQKDNDDDEVDRVATSKPVEVKPIAEKTVKSDVSAEKKEPKNEREAPAKSEPSGAVPNKPPSVVDAPVSKTTKRAEPPIQEHKAAAPRTAAEKSVAKRCM